MFIESPEQPLSFYFLYSTFIESPEKLLSFYFLYSSFTESPGLPFSIYFPYKGFKVGRASENMIDLLYRTKAGYNKTTGSPLYQMSYQFLFFNNYIFNFAVPFLFTSL